jgi:hypothetical protein
LILASVTNSKRMKNLEHQVLNVIAAPPKVARTSTTIITAIGEVSTALWTTLCNFS